MVENAETNVSCNSANWKSNQKSNKKLLYTVIIIMLEDSKSFATKDPKTSTNGTFWIYPHLDVSQNDNHLTTMSILYIFLLHSSHSFLLRVSQNKAHSDPIKSGFSQFSFKLMEDFIFFSTLLKKESSLQRIMLQNVLSERGHTLE